MINPCPFCRSTEVSCYPNDHAEHGHEMGVPGTDSFYVHCDCCGADGSVKDNHDEAIAAWNGVAQINLDDADFYKWWEEEGQQSFAYSNQLPNVQQLSQGWYGCVTYLQQKMNK